MYTQKMIKENKRWGDIFTNLYLFLLVYLSAAALEGTSWVSGLNHVTHLAILGGLAGLAIGQSKFNFKRLLYFAYHAFLTLTDKSIFLLLNIIIGIFAILCFTILPWLSIIIFIAGGINAWTYYKANQVDYFKRIEILDVYRQKVTLD